MNKKNENDFFLFYRWIYPSQDYNVHYKKQSFWHLLKTTFNYVIKLQSLLNIILNIKWGEWASSYLVSTNTDK